MADTTAAPAATAAQRPLWLMMLAACVIVALSMGIRQVMGLYLKPITSSLGVGREAFGFAMAVANLVWGAGAPFAGAIADKYGTGRVVAFGALMTVIGLVTMRYGQSELMLVVSGFFLGLGVCGTGVTILVGAVGRAATPEKRTNAIAAIGLGSGFGQLLAIPYTHLLIEMSGWQQSLIVLAVTTLVMLPLAAMFGGNSAASAAGKPQTLKEALSEAFGHPSFWLLTAGFFVCGFHVSFYAVHLPAFVTDKGLTSNIAMWALVVVGIGNLVGTWLAGKSAQYVPKRYSLCFIYLGRAAIFLAILYVPITEVSILILSALLGLLWLSTVPLTSSMVATLDRKSVV